MEKFLKDLKKDVLSKYDNQAVIVYPVVEKDCAIFEITNHRCRIYYLNSLDFEVYTQKNTVFLNTDPQLRGFKNVTLYHDSIEERCIQEFIYKNKFHCIYAVGQFEDILEYIDKWNPKLLRNLLDCDVLMSAHDLGSSYEPTQESNIKKVYGAPVKYIKATGIWYSNFAKWCYEHNFSVEETKILNYSLRQRELYRDAFTVKELKYLCTISRPTLQFYYKDYLRMRKWLINWDIDVSSFSQFPIEQNIRKFHDNISLMYNRIYALKRQESLQNKNNNYLEKHYPKACNFEYHNNDYSIIACKNLSDLIIEGSELHHCVASYTDSVADGHEYILFLRKNNSLDTPYFTIDILPNKKVRQIHGKNNCNITDDIKSFIQEWANIYNLDISNTDGVLAHV